jgi:hypothetical protein
MAPDTRTAEIKRLKESVELTKRETNHKYELLVTLVKEQGQKLDTTIDCHGTNSNRRLKEFAQWSGATAGVCHAKDSICCRGIKSR